jgi:cysteine desulfurase
MQLPVYLDYMATTPVDPRVAKKMLACLELTGNFGNPASRSHVYGWRAEEAVDLARQQVANCINADVREIVWTSGATEAINLALQGAAYFYQRKGKHIVTWNTEHKAVLDTCQHLKNQGFDVTVLKPQANGLVDQEALLAALRPETILVSVLHVNNEIGVIQDIAALSKITRPRGILLHVDGAQSIGKARVDVQALDVDLMSFCAHKVYGPKGAGALYVRRNPRVHLQPLIYGGGHEQGLRSGTLAVHQVVGMGHAFYLAQNEWEDEAVQIRKLRDYLWESIRLIPALYLNGDFEQRVPHNLNISIAGVEGESLFMSLKDLAISSGSACNAATMQPSHVLQALGRSRELAHSSIRFSLGRFTTQEEIDFAILHVKESIQQLRA